MANHEMELRVMGSHVMDGHVVSVLDVAGMFCHDCVEKIETEISALPGVQRVKVRTSVGLYLVTEVGS